MTAINTTHTLNLPTEILLVVASHCSPSTTCTLALLNSGLSDAVAPLLYRNVKINNLDSLRQFVRTLTDIGRPHLKLLPLSLDIDLQQNHLVVVYYFHTLLQAAISHIPNLQNLALRVAPIILERLFQNLQYSLPLTRFTCPLWSGKGLSRFLNSQHTLEELIFSHAISHFTSENLGDINPQSLPNLRSVSANLDTLGILIPGRPVNQASTGTWRLRSGEFAAFTQVLSLSTAQLEFIEVSLILGDAIPCLSNDDGLFPALRRHAIQPSRLTLNLSPFGYHYPLESERYQNQYHSLLKVLGDLDLDGFTRLVTFEIVQRLGTTAWVTRDQPFVQEHSVFETMKQACPSLKMLHLFGLEIQ